MTDIFNNSSVITSFIAFFCK